MWYRFYKFLIISAFFLVAPLSFAYAQKSVLDSLLHVLHQADNDTVRVECLNNLCVQYRDSDPVAAKNYGKQALKLADSLNLKKEQANALNNLGILIELSGDLSGALNNYLKALEIRKVLNDTSAIAGSLNNVGIIYKKQGNHAKAVAYYSEALLVFDALNNKKAQAIMHNNLGLSYKALEDNELSEKHYLDALKLFIELGSESGQAVIYNNLASFYKEEGQFEKALKFYQLSLDIRIKEGNVQGEAVIYNNLGELKEQMGFYDEAIAYGLKSLKINQQMGYKDVQKHNYILLNNAYRKNGQLSKAYEILTKLELLKDSLITVENQKQLAELEVRFETTKKEQEIIMLNQDRKIKALAFEKIEEEIRYQRMFIALVCVTCILIMIGLIIIYKRLQITKRQKLVIEEQKIIVDEANEELNQQNEEILAQRDEIERQKMILETKNKEITDSINYAKKIQRALLYNKPVVELKYTLPEQFIFFKPKDIVSGDFYWKKQLNKFFYIAAVDCTGHGVPGAFMSMLGVAFLNEIVTAETFPKPSRILDELKDKVVSELSNAEENYSTKDGMDIALIRLDLETREVIYAGAHNPMYIFRENQILEFKADKIPIGVSFRKEDKKFTDQQVKLQAGDTIYIFSDGYADQFGGENDKKFGYQRFKDLLVTHGNHTMAEQKKQLEKNFINWKGRMEQTDDICIIGVKII